MVGALDAATVRDRRRRAAGFSVSATLLSEKAVRLVRAVVSGEWLRAPLPADDAQATTLARRLAAGPSEYPATLT
jgi:hypothetical protein